MGLDIQIHAKKSGNDNSESTSIQSLSRIFCNLMSRPSVIDGEPELNQIGRITGIDISALYAMENYPIQEYIDDEIEFADNENEKQEIIQKSELLKAQIEGNIAKVKYTVESLIDRLSTLDSLPSLLNANGYDTLNSSVYFSEFTQEKGDGYTGNNLGRDLRIFKEFLETAQIEGNTTVYFRYG